MPARTAASDRVTSEPAKSRISTVSTDQTQSRPGSRSVRVSPIVACSPPRVLRGEPGGFLARAIGVEAARPGLGVRRDEADMIGGRRARQDRQVEEGGEDRRGPRLDKTGRGAVDSARQGEGPRRVDRRLDLHCLAARDLLDNEFLRPDLGEIERENRARSDRLGRGRQREREAFARRRRGPQDRLGEDRRAVLVENKRRVRLGDPVLEPGLDRNQGRAAFVVLQAVHIAQDHRARRVLDPAPGQGEAQVPRRRRSGRRGRGRPRGSPPSASGRSALRGRKPRRSAVRFPAVATSRGRQSARPSRSRPPARSSPTDRGRPPASRERRQAAGGSRRPPGSRRRGR